MQRLTRITLAALTISVVVAHPSLLRAQSESATANLYRESYALEAKHEYAGALAKVHDVTRTSGRTYFATMRLAWLAYLAGDFAASQAEYAVAIAAEPKSIEPKLGLTLPLLAARNWKDLDRACREALVVDPHNATALARLALAQYWGGSYAEAVATYRQLVVDYPSDLDYKTGLGWAYVKLGRLADARPVFEAVLAVSPDNTNAKQGLAVK